jgi:phosphohistidine phosphatase
VNDVRLTLIRHAKAAERAEAYPDDSLRPLIPEGEQQAKRLSRLFKLLGCEFDLIFSSPYTRAAQTAEPLASCLKRSRHIQYLDSLTGADFERLFLDLHDRLTPDDQAVALVGHEPFLSGLASYLIAGSSRHAALNVKKGAFLELSGELRAGGMTLRALVPYRIYRHL